MNIVYFFFRRNIVLSFSKISFVHETAEKIMMKIKISFFIGN